MSKPISSSMSSVFASGISRSPMSDIWSMTSARTGIRRGRPTASRHRLGPALGRLQPWPRAARGGRTSPSR
eukprot:13056437-Alexandrium_andersonii.AAC.1